MRANLRLHSIYNVAITNSLRARCSEHFQMATRSLHHHNLQHPQHFLTEIQWRLCCWARVCIIKTFLNCNYFIREKMHTITMFVLMPYIRLTVNFCDCQTNEARLSNSPRFTLRMCTCHSRKAKESKTRVHRIRNKSLCKT